MPIYEYECKSCHHQLEVMQKISDPKLTNCPNCHKESLEKLVSAAGFHLKGGGWYVTDFKDKGKQESGSKNQESGAKSQEVSADK